MSDGRLPVVRHLGAGAGISVTDDAGAREHLLERRRGLPPRPLAHVIEGWQEKVQPLLRQQCWCWAWDARRPAGDLLLQRRFERSEPSGPGPGSDAYRLTGTGYRIGLWWFGVFYARRELGAVFVGPHVDGPWRSPLVSPPRDVWTQADLPRTSPLGRNPDAADLHLLVELFRWIARYERWVQRIAGAGHREAAVMALGDQAFVPATEMAATWSALGRGSVRG